MTYWKDKATADERALSEYIEGVTGVETTRRVGHGSQDRGDINVTGVPVMVEMKSTKLPHFTEWKRQVDRQIGYAGARWGVLVWSPPGLGPKSLNRWAAIEWRSSAISPFGSGGYLYDGKMNRLASALRTFRYDLPMYVRDPDEKTDVTWARIRSVECWVADLQETIAATAATRPTTPKI